MKPTWLCAASHQRANVRPNTAPNRPISNSAGINSRTSTDEILHGPQWATMRPFGSSALLSKNLHRGGKRRCSCTRLELFLLGLLALLIGTLSVLCAVWLLHFNGSRLLERELMQWSSNGPNTEQTTLHNICTTRECVKVAARLASNIDEKLDPCDDFYEFACAHYADQNEPANAPFRSLITDAQRNLQWELRHLLEAETTSEDKPWERLAKHFYADCLNEQKIAQTEYGPIRKLLSEALGGWPLSESWTEFSEKWEERLAHVFLTTGFSSALMQFTIGHDPKNSSRNVIEIQQPSLGLGSRWLYANDPDSHALKSYAQLMTDLMHGMGANATETDIREIVELERKLASLASDDLMITNPHRANNQFQLWKLRDTFPSIDLSGYIQAIFKDLATISPNETVIVRGMQYIAGLQELAKNTTKRVLSNYIGWRLVQNYVHFLPSADRQIFRQFRANLTGMPQREVERWEECVDLSSGLLEAPVGRMYIDKHFADDATFAVEKAKLIIDYVKKAFVAGFNETPMEISEQTRKRIVQKALSMHHKLGFPSELLNDSRMQRDWNYGQFEQIGDFFEFAIRVKVKRIRDDLSNYKEPVDRNAWLQSAAQVDAFYSPAMNEMTFPAGILRNPFLMKSLPNYALFAMLGTILAHEFSHAFCDQGHNYDETGSLNEHWLDKEALKNYRENAECLVRQYDQDRLDGQRPSGRVHLSENLADNSALKLAYNAYDMWRRESGEVEAALVGFQNYTVDQIFFITYANNWCTSTNLNYVKYMNADLHAPARLRATIPLRNLPEFSNAFNCSVDSRMNPRKKCSTW